MTQELEHVHRCPQCGHLVKGDEIPYQAIVSGVMTCSKCEYSGPINIQIVPTLPEIA
jgi:DNA-directed RNA polymerase subunit M/transcription elongation factor TFIIS